MFVLKMTRRLPNFFISPVFHIGLILFGMILRLKFYFENRSLWTDESCLAIAIVNRSFSEIWQNVEIFPELAKAPLIFLFIEKFMVTLLGNHELALRLFPLLCGLGSLILFYFFLKNTVGPKTLTLALALFAISERLIYYSAEVKQYSSDVFVSLLLCLIFTKMNHEKLRPLNIFVLSITGALAIWLSSSCLFILAGLGIILTGYCCLKKQWTRLLMLLPAFALWGISFLSLYKVSLSHMVDNQTILVTWQGALMPQPLLAWKNLIWLKSSCLNALRDPGGFRPLYLTAFFFILGSLSLFKKNRKIFFLLLLPIVLTLLAAILQKYPFRSRLLLFLLPAIFIFMAQGIVFLIKLIHKSNLGKSSPFLIGLTLFALLLYKPVEITLTNLFIPRVIEDNRFVLEAFKKHFQPGDSLFLDSSAQFSYWYYASQMNFSHTLPKENLGKRNSSLLEGHKIAQFPFSPSEHQGINYVPFRYVYHLYNTAGYFRESVVLNNGDNKNIVIENKRLPFALKGRVWLFFSTVSANNDKLKAIILSGFDKQGKRIQYLERKGASIYLYELS